MKKKLYIVPVFVPDLGCPHQCVFCNQKKITGQESVTGHEKVSSIVGDYLSTIPRNNESRVEIAFYGGSFTAIPMELQRKYLAEARSFLEDGRVNALRISTRPDYIHDENLSLLMAYGVETIELGVQSVNDEVLSLSGRGHSTEEVFSAARLIKSWGFFLGIQLMIGLPGDSQEKALDTCNKVISMQPDFVRIYPVLVLKGTELEGQYKKGLYQPWSLEQVVDTAKVWVNRFRRANIEVIRIGLQNTEEISPAGEIVAGPYHPAFGELVYGGIYLELLRMLLQKAQISRGSANLVEIMVNQQEESKVRGHKSANLKTIKDECKLQNLVIVREPNLTPGNLVLSKIDNVTVNYRVDVRELLL